MNIQPPVQDLAENTPASTGQQPPATKKRRAARACERCRAKKYKCDESFPCRKCTKSQVQCVYDGDFQIQRESQTASYIHELESRIEELNERLREVTLSSQSFSKTPSSATAATTVTTSGRSILNQELSPESIICENETPTSDALEEEIREVNGHTNAIEFHGNTSSAAALGHLQRAREPAQGNVASKRYMHAYTNPSPTPVANYSGSNGKPKTSLISALHNPNFYTSQLQSSHQDGDRYPSESGKKGSPSAADNRYYFEYAHVFMEGYFENIHFIHPLIDKESFVLRAHNLWFGKDPQPDSGFIALYLSLLSLGALIRAWDQPRLGGLTRFEWSRRLFVEAQGYLNTWCFTNNLEIVQALYLMAKICQNELAPHLAYMYLGLAIRTCLAAGYNRETPDVKTDQHDWISRTWWGLYSLEIEMSFSLGRPDTLGMDEYHNRCQPNRDEHSEYTLIPIMVDLAHLVRRVSVEIYHSRISLQQRMRHSLEIEQKLNDWADGLPKVLQLDFGQSTGRGDASSSMSVLRDPKWSRRQRLVLGIRYHNVQMFIFRPFLAYLTQNPKGEQGQTRVPEAQRLLEMAAKKCLYSARKTVDIIYDTFRQYSFFRCWWYNTTYIMFAVTNMLLPLSRKSLSFLSPMETSLLMESVNKSIQILEAMDESVVAQESMEIIKHHLREYCADINDLISPTSTTSGSNEALHNLGGEETGFVDMRAAGSSNQIFGMYQQDTPEDVATAAATSMLDLSDMHFEEFYPELTLSMGSNDYPFESIAGLFGDITGPTYS